MGRLNSIWDYIARHKYLITITLGVLIIGVLDENSVMRLVSLNIEIDEANQTLEEYVEQYKSDSAKIHEYETSVSGVRRIAREKFFMKQDDEDVYVLSTDREEEKEHERVSLWSEQYALPLCR